MDLSHVTLQTIQSTGGHHLTEDAGWGGVYENQAILVAADGAPLRFRPMNSLQPLLDKYAARYGAGITPSGVAARLIRDTVAEQSGRYPAVPLADMLIRANQRLTDELVAIYGELTAEAVAEQEPALTILREDARYLRLALPVATYAAMRVNWQTQTLEVAQGADAAVFAIYTDGTVKQLTPDQMAQHDTAAKELWLNQPDAPAEHPFFRALGDNRGMEVNRINGLYHNYVGPNGEIDEAVGVSVVDGLPEIIDYMFTLETTLDDVQALLVTSDGMFWPAPPDETEAQASQRVQQMGERIMRDGLDGYVAALRAEETRLRETGINPYQFHDDATGLLLRLPADR